MKADPWHFAIRLIPRFFQGLLLLVLLFPLIDFAEVAFGRMMYPYEVEWLEGELAIYTIRWMETPSLAHLYPPYEEGRYVPHLYPPVYQITTAFVYENLGFLFWEPQSDPARILLPVGRFVSILATFAIMAAVVMIVREGSRSWFCGVAGALTYPMYYKVSGFWYDIYKVDSLAYAFAMWSCYLIARARGGPASLVGGIILAALALMTKQTSIFLPILALGVRVALSLADVFTQRTPGRWLSLRPGKAPVYRHAGAVLMIVAPVMVLAANSYYWSVNPEDNQLGFYLFAVPSNHFIFYNKIVEWGYQELWQYYIFMIWWIPIGLWIFLLGRWQTGLSLALMAGAGAAAGFGSYAMLQTFDGAWIIGKPSIASPEVMKYTASTWPVSLDYAAAATAAGLAAAAVRWLLYRTTTPGLWWLGVLFTAMVVGAVTWVKIGGYVNNFIPLFAAQAAAFGFAASWLFTGARRMGEDAGVSLAAILLASITWISWEGTRPLAIPAEPAAEAPVWHRQEVLRIPPPADERDRQEIRDEPRPPQMLSDTLPWWLTDGLRYDRPKAPHGRQIPSKTAQQWGDKLIERLRELGENQRVYLPHQNFLGWMAGISIQPSVDSIRDVEYVTGKSPEPLLDRVRNKEYDVIVTMMELQYEWMPQDFRRLMEQNYRRQGPLLKGAPPEAYRPVTGATVRPELIYVPK